MGNQEAAMKFQKSLDYDSDVMALHPSCFLCIALSHLLSPSLSSRLFIFSPVPIFVVARRVFSLLFDCKKERLFC